MLPQPPPNAEAPPVSQEALRSQCLWLAVWMTGILSIIILLYLASYVWAATHSGRRHGTGYTMEAEQNARQIGLALEEFEMDYGKFPDESTIDAVRGRTATELPLGTTTSNDFFRQLIATDICSFERMFYAKWAGSKVPDNNFSGNQALAKGEVGFAYLVGLSSKGNPSRPLAVAPIIPGTDRFDFRTYGGRAVILKTNGSVSVVDIDKAGHVVVDGHNLLDARNPFWEDEKWRLVWPE